MIGKSKKIWQTTQPSTPEDWSLISLYYIDASYLLTPPPEAPGRSQLGNESRGTGHAAAGPRKNRAISFTCQGYTTAEHATR